MPACAQGRHEDLTIGAGIDPVRSKNTCCGLLLVSDPHVLTLLSAWPRARLVAQSLSYAPAAHV